MYDFIFNYYHFNPSSISKKNNYYLVAHDNYSYYLYEVYDLNKVKKQYEIASHYPFYYSFILNYYHSIFSEYHNHVFVLLKNNNLLKVDYHYYFSNIIILSDYKNNWYYSWLERSDYLEDKYYEIKGKYPIIDESFDYYLGLLEMSIYYLRHYNYISGNGYLQHERYSKKELYNPLNIKIDFKERDFAEYLKYIFFSKEYLNIDISCLIYQNRNNYNFGLVFARILYPNYYFDVFDKIVFFNEDEIELKKIIDCVQDFKNYVNYILLEMNKYYYIKKVSF